jgi:hypothetical protein
LEQPVSHYNKEYKGEMFMSIQSFTIAIPQATLDDVRERLARTRWPDGVAEAGWDYGTNLNYLKNLVAYWQHQYNWRTHEAKLNQFAHFSVPSVRYQPGPC